MKNSKFIGTGVALITPFNKDFSVDYDSLKILVEHNITNGIDYLVINGTTAESPTINLSEKELIIKLVVSVNKLCHRHCRRWRCARRMCRRRRCPRRWRRRRSSCS